MKTVQRPFQPAVRCKRCTLRHARTLRLIPQATSTEVEDLRVAEVRANVTKRIKQLGQAGRPKEAIKELASLAQVGVQPDTRAATALVAACVASRKMELAETVFEQLFGDFLEPDEVTFAVLVRGFGATDPPQWAQIDRVLTNMRTNYGIQASTVAYNALLEICARTNDVDRGLDVVDRMREEDVEPDETSWDIVQYRRTLRSHLRKTFG